MDQGEEIESCTWKMWHFPTNPCKFCGKRAVLTWHEIRTSSSLIFSPSIILTRRLPLCPFSHLVASTLGLLERAKPNLCVLQQQKAIVRGHCESRAIYWTGNKANIGPLVLLSSHSLCFSLAEANDKMIKWQIYNNKHFFFFPQWHWKWCITTQSQPVRVVKMIIIILCINVEERTKRASLVLSRFLWCFFKWHLFVWFSLWNLGICLITSNVCQLPLISPMGSNLCLMFNMPNCSIYYWLFGQNLGLKPHSDQGHSQKM